MAVDKELTEFINKVLGTVPIPNPKPKRHVGFKIKSWRWVDRTEKRGNHGS